MIKIEKQIDKLRKCNPALNEILIASPFDSSHNIDGKMTEDIFFEYLHVKSNEYDLLKKEIEDNIESTIQKKYIFLFDGYSGIGKTTFLKWYFWEKKRVLKGIGNEVYIDFFTISGQSKGKTKKEVYSDNFMPNLEFALTNKKAIKENHTALFKGVIKNMELVNPIVSVFKGYIQGIVIDDKKSQKVNDFLNILINKKDVLSIPFSNVFNQFLGKYKKTIKLKKDFHNLLSISNSNDTYLLFHILCFILLNRNKKAYIVFDNLDAIHLEYLSEYFRNDMFNSISEAEKLSQGKDLFGRAFDFTNNFKYIISIRDTNGSVINQHILRAFHPYCHKLNMKYLFNASFFDEIIEKRIKLYEILNSDNHGKSYRESTILRSLMRDFLEDEYSKEVVVPLFNFNLCKISLALFEMSKALFENYHSILALKTKGFQLYGNRSNLIFGILKYLFNNDIFLQYPFLRERLDDSEGNCSITRMLLTIITNLSEIQKSSDILSDPNFSTKSIALKEILEQTENLYEPKQVVKALEFAFRLHEYNWINFISIKNIPQKTNLFEDEDMIQLPDVKDITISINPSGFIYLKNIITHFEFYANIVKNDRSLFSIGVNEIVNKEFLFEKYIRSVRYKVEQNVKSMKNYYESVIMNKVKMNSYIYKRSRLVFKHFDKPIYENLFQEDKSNIGLFHITRVITSHINYLNKYRLYLIKDVSEKDENKASILNKTLIEHIKEYIKLLDYVPDKEERKNYKNIFQVNIDKIERRKYFDFTTSIEKRKYF